MKLIPLTQGKFAMVDDDVFEWASKFKWRAMKGGNTFYAVRTIRLVSTGPRAKSSSRQKLLHLHREILSAPEGVWVDHRDCNGLNDCVSNIRLCSSSGNSTNRPKSAKNTSGYKGVSSCKKKTLRWKSAIRLNGRGIHLGYFDTALEAALAYDAAAVELFGEFARLNFPKEVPCEF